LHDSKRQTLHFSQGTSGRSRELSWINIQF
jgi:hypothetical protein